jgi:tripeptidyl-peptidase-1
MIIVMWTSFLLSIALLGLSTATRLAPLRSRRYVVKERHSVPRDFAWESDVPADHQIRLQVALKQNRFNELERHLYEVSDPDHARYGQHLSASEVNELLSPSSESLALIQEWLHSHINPKDITYSPAKDFLSITLPVAKVEELLQTKYSVYRHTDGSKIVRAPQWKLPLHLHEHVTAVQPTTSFLRTLNQGKMLMGNVKSEKKTKTEVTAKKRSGTVAEVCDARGVTSLCLRTLYET